VLGSFWPANHFRSMPPASCIAGPPADIDLLLYAVHGCTDRTRIQAEVAWHSVWMVAQCTSWQHAASAGRSSLDLLLPHLSAVLVVALPTATKEAAMERPPGR
jgi:hypothetical protein